VTSFSYVWNCHRWCSYTMSRSCHHSDLSLYWRAVLLTWYIICLGLDVTSVCAADVVYCVVPPVARRSPLSVRPWQVAALQNRWEIGLYGYIGLRQPIGSHLRATQGSHPQPSTIAPSAQTGGSRLQSKLASQIEAKRRQILDTTAVCIDNLWEYTIALPISSLPSPTPFPKRG